MNSQALNSRHESGDAADVASNSATWQELHDAGKLVVVANRKEKAEMGTFTSTGAEHAPQAGNCGC